MLAQCPNTPYGRWGTSGGYIGIQTNNPNKPLHIFSSNVCTEAAIRLEYQGIPPYWGHLALICPNNLNNYSSIGLASDIILQADTNAGNVLITARNKGKAIKFSTTTSNSQPNTFFDYERFRISEDGYNTMVDIKVPELVPFHGSPILRFQRLQPNGQPLTFPGNNWHMGIDVNDTVTAFKFGAMDSTCALFDDTKSFTFTKEGNLGIGTGNPTSQFHIFKGQSSIRFGINELTSDPFTYSSKSDGSYPGSYCHWEVIYGCDLQFLFKKDNLIHGNIFYGEEYTKIVFTEEGNVGIGISNPAEKLVVDGKICAKEVMVQISGEPCWGDYVFDEKYQLMPLKELESKIRDNKHLPGVPSAKEIESNGLQIGEMQSIMMKKIEELTLYVIDLQKQCNNLKKQLDDKNNREE